MARMKQSLAYQYLTVLVLLSTCSKILLLLIKRAFPCSCNPHDMLKGICTGSLHYTHCLMAVTGISAWLEFCLGRKFHMKVARVNNRERALINYISPNMSSPKGQQSKISFFLIL